jgi:hypothetical protein
MFVDSPPASCSLAGHKLHMHDQQPAPPLLEESWVLWDTGSIESDPLCITGCWEERRRQADGVYQLFFYRMHRAVRFLGKLGVVHDKNEKGPLRTASCHPAQTRNCSDLASAVPRFQVIERTGAETTMAARTQVGMPVYRKSFLVALSWCRSL